MMLFLAFLFSVYHICGLILRYKPFRSEVTPVQKKKLQTAYFCVLLTNWLVCYAVFLRIGVSLAITKADYFLIPVVLLLINMLLIPGRAKEHLFVYGIVATCDLMLSALPTMLISRTVGFDGFRGLLLLAVMQMLIQILCFPFIHKLLKNTVEPFLSLEQGNYWGTIWFIPIAMLLSAMVLFPGNVHVQNLNQLVSRAMIGIATILMCYSIAADHRRLQEKQTISEQLVDQKLHYAQLQTKVEDARKKGHDFKHHIAAIRRFVDNDDKEGLRKYCDALYAQTSTEAEAPYTGNPAADGVVYRYIQLAHRENIQFDYRGTIRSDGIEDVDLCVLLGNALDNALTGCMRIREDRRILVTAKAEGKLLSLMVKNTFDGVIKQKNDTLLSLKRENRTGVGLASMRSICQRYSGQMDTFWDESTFTVMILLPLESE